MLTGNIIAKENSLEFSKDGKGTIFVVAPPEVSEKVSNYYFENFEQKPFDVLKKSVDISLSPNIIATGFFNGILYFATFGEAEIKIGRNESIQTILRSEGTLQSASGYPKEGDLIYLKTPEGKMVIKFENRKSNRFSFPINSNKKIYLKPQTLEEVNPESKKMTFLIAIFLLILLFVTIFIGVNKKRNNDLKSKYNDILHSANEDLQQAISLATSDPEKSRELFINSEDNLNKINELKIKDNEIDLLKQKIDSSRQSILGEYNEKSSLFLDLGLLSSGFKGNTISVTGGKLFVLDKVGKKIVSIEIGTKKSKVVAGPNVITDAIDLASYENNVYVMESDGIYEIDTQRKKIIDKVWSNEAFIKIFAGNMYVLDKSANMIYRYVGNQDRFGDKNNWLSSSISTNFSEAKGWGIDGAVYILYPNSKILKYSQGSPQTFRLTGVVPEIGNIDALFADPNNTNLYLLDKAGRRIVVTDKSGKYKAQYLDDKIGEAINLAVSEADKKIILLTGEKLLQIELKHQ